MAITRFNFLIQWRKLVSTHNSVRTDKSLFLLTTPQRLHLNSMLTKNKTKSLHKTSSSDYKEMLCCWFVWRVFWQRLNTHPATAVCDPADSTTPHTTRLKTICMLETPQQRPPSPLGTVLSGWKSSGTHGGLLFKPQTDPPLMAQRHNRTKEGISLFLMGCLTPSVSHCLQETDYISTKAVRMRERACGRRMSLQKLGRLRVCSLWMHLKDLNRKKPS